MSDIWTPGQQRLVEASVLPRSALPRDTQMDLTASLTVMFAEQRSAMREMTNHLRDIAVALGATSIYSANPAVRAAARAQQFLVGGGDGIGAMLEPDALPAGPAGVPLVGSNPAEDAVIEEQKGKRRDLWKPTPIPTSYKGGRRTGWAAARDWTYASIARRLSDTNFGGDYRYEQVRLPSGLNIAEGRILTLDSYDQFIRPDDEGQYVWRDPGSRQVVDQRQASATMRRVMMADSMRRMAGTLAETGNFGQAVRSLAPRMAMRAGAAAAGVGMAIEGAQRAYQFLQTQTDRNRPFQAVLGGTNTNSVENFGERLRQNIFRIGNKISFNPISDSVSNEIYRGAMEIYAGDRDMRRTAEDAMLRLYRQTGMSPQESLRVISLAASEGNEAIGRIADALKNVTQTAREAGINAKEARDRFEQTFRTVSQTFTGIQAISFAEAQTNTITALGRRFQNIALNETSQPMIQMIAAQTGMTPAQVIAKMQEGGGAGWYAEQREQITNAAVRQMTGDQGRDIVRKYMRNGTLPAKGTAEFERMSRELLAITGDPAQFAQSLAMFGIENVAPDQVGEVIAMSYMGEFDTSKQVRDKAADFDVTSEGLPGDKWRDQTKWLQKTFNLSDTDAQQIWRDVQSGKIVLEGRKGDIARYLKKVTETGQRSQVMERLLNNYDPGRRFQVQTKDGPVVVRTREMIENFLDQADQAKAEIVAGEGKGATIGEHIQAPVTELKANRPGAPTPESAQREYTGRTFEKDVGDGGGKGESVTLRVVAGDELRRWIDIQATDGARIDWASGTPPSSTPVASDLPGGG